MGTNPETTPALVTETVDEASLREAEKFIEAEEGAVNRMGGWIGKAISVVAIAMSLFHLYAAYAIVPTQELRYGHVGFTLFLTFLLFPIAARFRDRIRWWGRNSVAVVGRCDHLRSRRRR